MDMACGRKGRATLISIKANILRITNTDMESSPGQMGMFTKETMRWTSETATEKFIGMMGATTKENGRQASSTEQASCTLLMKDSGKASLKTTC